MGISEKGELAPVFITGVWRSGTTLVSRIMNNHKELDITYDTVHFLRFSINRYDPIGEVDNVRQLISDTVQRLHERYELVFSIEETMEDLNGIYTYASIYNSIMNNLLLKKSNKSVWGEKTNLAWSKIPDFFNMFPNGRVIHILRDPRAVLSSWKKFTNSHGNDYLDSIVNSFDSMDKALNYDKQYSDKRYITIKYEDLVGSPDKIIRKICDKFEINDDDDMLNVETFTNIKGKQWKTNSSHDADMKGISTIVIDKWKDELEDWEIFLTESIFAHLMDKFSYKTTNIKKSNELIDKIINEVQKSNLATDGLLRFLLNSEGIERYPTNPLNQKSWSCDTD